MIHAVLRLAWVEIVIGARRPLNLATGIVAPLMFLALLLWPRLGSLQPEQTAVAVSGVLLAALWSASLWSGASIIRRERAQGTLGAMVTGRLAPEMAVLGKVLGTVTYDFALILATNTLFLAVAGLQVRVEEPSAFLVGIVLVFVCGIASSFMFSGVLVLTRFGYQLTTAVNTPVLLLGGTLIPYAALPGWIETIGTVLNISWLQRFLVSSVTGDVDWTTAMVAVGLSLTYAAAGVLCMRVLLRRARKEASLELV